MYKVTIAVALAISVSTISFAQEQASAPAYQDGDWWHFRVTPREWASYSSNRLEGDYEVHFSGGEFKVYALKSRNKTEIQQADALKRMVDNKRDDRQYLQFPLAMGNKWTNEYNVDGVGKGSSYALIRRKADVQVVGFEEVITPAGAFKTYKIERNEVSTSGRIVYTYFYSPQAEA